MTIVYAIISGALTLGVIYGILTICTKVAPKSWRADWKNYLDNEQNRRDVFKDANEK
ncbi:hypothetical protein LCGC14_1612370 [marine sediment metagenome]|uniref:Uncharacterized protein n=1 Tax=marine sediment metagenome TaxID=412755 RepID=A0A0F9L854_9ZZZZ